MDKIKIRAFCKALIINLFLKEEIDLQTSIFAGHSNDYAPNFMNRSE
jgi:hypothetical protein